MNIEQYKHFHRSPHQHKERQKILFTPEASGLSSMTHRRHRIQCRAGLPGRSGNQIDRN